MTEPQQSNRRVPIERMATTIALDTVDQCRMRLIALRTRIETNWPQVSGRFIRRGGLSSGLEVAITDLLVALPEPLPLAAGAEPEPLFTQGETDLCLVTGRAVDAAFALLAGGALDATYPGSVKMLESYHPDAPDPIVVPNPTVGLLVSTIIGTLDAVAELIGNPDFGKPKTAPPKPKSSGKQQPPPPPSRRGPSVPRI